MDATSGNSTGVTFTDRLDSAISSLKDAGQTGQQYVSSVGTSLSQHYSDNKDAYHKTAAVAAFSVATLAGLSYCRSIGFTKNYGKQKTKIIEKALRQLPVSDLKDIISKAQSLPKLSRRQRRALTMTKNYLRCVENSLDVSDKFNAKRRQVILRFKAFLSRDGEDGPIDVDNSAALAAERELIAFGITDDMDDDAIDDWLDGDDDDSDDESVAPTSQSIVTSQIQQKPVVASEPTTTVKPLSVLDVGKFRFKIPEKHIPYLSSKSQIDIYKSSITASLREMRISTSAVQVPIHLKDKFITTLMNKIPDSFWC